MREGDGYFYYELCLISCYSTASSETWEDIVKDLVRLYINDIEMSKNMITWKAEPAERNSDTGQWSRLEISQIGMVMNAGVS